MLMQRYDFRLVMIAFFISLFAGCSNDPATSSGADAGAGASGGNGGNGGMDGGSGASGSGGAAGGDDAGDASCPSTDASPPCEKALTSDIFDPGEVYLGGGSCRAVAHVSCPNVAAMGFGCAADRNSYIRPTDGRLLYRYPNEPGVREFHMDGCLRVAGAANDPFPPTPTANDPLLRD